MIACNSASAACLHDARERYPVPVVEVIRPAVRRAAAATRNGRVGVIGTTATITSGAYVDAFAAAPDVEVTAVACPQFVDFVERGVTSGRALLGLAPVGYLEPLQQADVDTLVLGCTHYPLLVRRDRPGHGRRRDARLQRGRDAPRTCTGCSPSADLLRRDDAPPPEHRFLATGDPEAPFARLARAVPRSDCSHRPGHTGPDRRRRGSGGRRSRPMRLTVLGCAGSFPGPDSPCSSYLVEADGFRLLLDFGTGSLSGAATVRPRSPRSTRSC